MQDINNWKNIYTNTYLVVVSTKLDRVFFNGCTFDSLVRSEWKLFSLSSRKKSTSVCSTRSRCYGVGRAMYQKNELSVILNNNEIYVTINTCVFLLMLIISLNNLCLNLPGFSFNGSLCSSISSGKDFLCFVFSFL